MRTETRRVFATRTPIVDRGVGVAQRRYGRRCRAVPMSFTQSDMLRAWSRQERNAVTRRLSCAGSPSSRSLSRRPFRSAQRIRRRRWPTTSTGASSPNFPSAPARFSPITCCRTSAGSSTSSRTSSRRPQSPAQSRLRRRRPRTELHLHCRAEAVDGVHRGHPARQLRPALDVQGALRALGRSRRVRLAPLLPAAARRADHHVDDRRDFRGVREGRVERHALQPQHARDREPPDEDARLPALVGRHPAAPAHLQRHLRVRAGHSGTRRRRRPAGG